MLFNTFFSTSLSCTHSNIACIHDYFILYSDWMYVIYVSRLHDPYSLLSVPDYQLRCPLALHQQSVFTLSNKVFRPKCSASAQAWLVACCNTCLYLQHSFFAVEYDQRGHREKGQRETLGSLSTEKGPFFSQRVIKELCITQNGKIW